MVRVESTSCLCLGSALGNDRVRVAFSGVGRPRGDVRTGRDLSDDSLNTLDRHCHQIFEILGFVDVVDLAVMPPNHAARYVRAERLDDVGACFHSENLGEVVARDELGCGRCRIGGNLGNGVDCGSIVGRLGVARSGPVRCLGHVVWVLRLM